MEEESELDKDLSGLRAVITQDVTQCPYEIKAGTVHEIAERASFKDEQSYLLKGIAWWLIADKDNNLYCPMDIKVGYLILTDLLKAKAKETKVADGTMTGFKSAVPPRVERSTNKIVFEGMSPRQAVEALIRMEEQDNTEVTIHVEFDKLHLVEALIAFQSALEERYGRFFAEVMEKPGMFGTQKIPPTLLGVEVGPGVMKEVLWGGFGIPGIEGQLETGIAMRNEMPIFSLNGKVKQRFKAEVDSLVQLTNEIAKRESIYKGKALELVFPDPEEVKNPLEYAPKFMVLGEANPPVFNDEIQAVIDNYIYEDIEATALTKQNHMPIKKGILLEGPPGVGKTLLAHEIAGKCVDYGWTFTYLKDVKDISKAVELVQRNGWGPAFVFAEDVDRVVGMDRTDAVNQVLNTIDGVNSKICDVVVLFTTNEIDVIHKTMLRPGRLDVLITIDPPDAATAQELIRREAGASLSTAEDIYAVGELLKGTMPAVVVQVVMRAKRAAQRRIRLAQGASFALDPPITAGDLVIAAKSMTKHIERLKPVPADERTPLEKAAATLAKAIEDTAPQPYDASGGLMWDQGKGKYVRRATRDVGDGRATE